MIATAIRKQSLASNELEPLDDKQATAIVEMLGDKLPEQKLPAICQLLALYLLSNPGERKALQAVRKPADLDTILQSANKWDKAQLARFIADDPIETKASTWQLQSTPCKKCSKRTFHVKFKQTRSADEPETQFSHCTSCSGPLPP